MSPVRWAARQGGPRACGDRVYVGDRFVVVLDGASHPDQSAHDGGWFASVLGTEIHDRLSQAPDAPLEDTVGTCIDRIAMRHRLTPGAAPSTTLSIVRWDTHSVEAFVLGDSPVIIERRDAKIDIVRDDRLRSVAQPQRQAFHRVATQQGFGFDHLPEWRALADAQQLARNRPGGYWIAEANSDAAQNALCAAWQTEHVAAVLVVTDGVAAGPDKYGQPASWAEAVVIARRDPRELIDIVHSTEETDPTGRRWPRSKCHDDKAAVFADLS